MTNPTNFQLHRTVVLVGMMGSGKSAIGRALAARLDASFVDSDAAIEEAAATTIPEIFERDGEAFFRERETEVLQRLLSGPPGVVSTGGGAFLAQRNREMISAEGVALWLNADLNTLWGRVRHKDTRPLLRTANPLATLTEIYEARTPIYAKAGLQLTIDGAASIDETTQAVIDTLLTRHDILETS